MNKHNITLVRSGFTIIELMIAVAIIGVLAALAIPAYSNYIKRSAVSEAMNMIGPFEDSISEYYMENKTFPQSNQDAELNAPDSYKGKYVTSITIDPNYGSTSNPPIVVTMNIPGLESSSKIYFFPKE